MSTDNKSGEREAAAVIAKAITTSTHSSGDEWAGNVLSALDAAGYAVVPKEPTEAMLNAIPASHSQSFQAIWPKICGDVYRSMLSAQVKEVDGNKPS